MPDLYALQKEFANAVVDSEKPVPAAIRGRTERRFAVYRNNVLVGLVDALATRFPVTLRLVGEEFFRAMARAYVEREPPRSPIMLLYGATFPAFIASFAPAASIPYLDAFASLEMARGRAYHAADARPLAAADFSALSPERLSETRIRLHPSASILPSRFPIVSIWEAHQGMANPAPLDSWEPEDALVSRPFDEVEVSRLPPGVAVFLRELAGGVPIGAAAEIAHQSVDCFDPTNAFATLIGNNLAIGLR